VGQVHEVQAEDPVLSGWPLNPVTFVLLVLGAFLGAVTLSALLAHPAGASTLPGTGTSGASTVGAASNVVHPAVAAVDALTDVVAPHSATPGSDFAAGPGAAVSPVAALLPVVTLWQAPGSALHGLAPVIEPISQATAPALGLVVTTLTSVPTPAVDTALPSAQPAAPSRVEPVTDTSTTRPLGTTPRFPGGPPALGLRTGPGAPDPAPAPAWPLQSFPLAPTGDSSLSSAGTALVAAPASGPLLPDPLVSGVIPAQSGIPRFLFDLRSSPPG